MQPVIIPLDEGTNIGDVTNQIVGGQATPCTRFTITESGSALVCVNCDGPIEFDIIDENRELVTAATKALIEHDTLVAEMNVLEAGMRQAIVDDNVRMLEARLSGVPLLPADDVTDTTTANQHAALDARIRRANEQFQTIVDALYHMEILRAGANDLTDEKDTLETELNAANLETAQLRHGATRMQRIMAVPGLADHFHKLGHINTNGELAAMSTDEFDALIDGFKNGDGLNTAEHEPQHAADPVDPVDGLVSDVTTENSFSMNSPANLVGANA